MKKLITKVMFAGFIAMALLCNSCQEEFEEVGNDAQETLESDSSTAQLIINTASKDGSFDNIVDEASCIAVQFPYTVEIAGVQITIDSIEDLHLIEDIFDEFDDDEDILEIIFPITITLADFTEVTIESKEALRELAAECREGGDDDDIECIDFVYPITLFTFDVDGQQAGSVVINSDEELRKFFKNREEGELISIDFPVTLKKFDGTEVQVSTNAELARVLEAAKDECDEDDDNDFNDDDFDEERFDFCLTECPWQVREVIRSNVDQTEQYLEYVLNFSDDGTVTAKDREGNVLNGDWSSSFTEDGPLLTLEFETLVDFNLEWLVYEIGDHTIKLYNGDGNKIIMKQLCGDEEECDVEEIANVLENCKWRIAESEMDFDFEGVIDFSNRNIHAYTENGASADEGNWEVTDTGLRFNSLSMDLEDMTGDWEIVECGDGRIKIVNGNGRYYILEKDCEFEVPKPETLRDILSECEWIIKKVKNEGEEIDRLLGYEFEFTADGVTLSDGITTSQGTWEVGTNNEGQLSLLITMGEEQAVSFDWPLRDLTNKRLAFEVDGTGYELLLQRVCNDNAGDDDVAEIRNIMLGGLWNVELYEENGMDMTETYDGFDFSFSNMHQVEVSVTDDPIAAGLWRVIRNADEKLKFYLNFSDPGNNFAPLTEVYYIEEVTAERMELIYETEEGTKVLVFAKP